MTDLPWQEIDEDGPIIALVTSSVMQEIDSKKRDGRLGQIARGFNRLISGVAAGGSPLLIRESNPRVELALSASRKIAWEDHDDLDPADGDSRFVAEVLFATGISLSDSIIVSHDIKPIALATNNGLSARHISDAWLRDPEPSPKDKEVQRLKAKLKILETVQPSFVAEIDLGRAQERNFVQIRNLEEDERRLIKQIIFEKNPKEKQNNGSGGFLGPMSRIDHTYDGRYENYRSMILKFVQEYEIRVERAFNQIPLKVKLKNSGQVQAENLLVEVSVSSGWLHDRYVLAAPWGPEVPRPRADSYLDQIIKRTNTPLPTRVGRHEFDYKDEPRWNAYLSATCEDFRQGQEWTFDGVLGVDPRASEMTVEVVVSASNFKGCFRKSIGFLIKTQAFHISDLIEVESLKFKVETPVHQIIGKKRYGMIDKTAFALNVDDD